MTLKSTTFMLFVSTNKWNPIGLVAKVLNCGLGSKRSQSPVCAITFTFALILLGKA